MRPRREPLSANPWRARLFRRLRMAYTIPVMKATLQKILLFLVCAVLGALALFSVPWTLRQHRAMTSYLPIAVRITSSSIVPVDRDSYGARIEYEYQVGGKTYSSRRVYPVDNAQGPLSSSHAEGAKLVAHYPAGTQQQGYYDPQDPSYAYLQRKVLFFPYMGLLYGCIFFAWSIQWLVEFARRIPPLRLLLIPLQRPPSFRPRTGTSCRPRPDTYTSRDHAAVCIAAIAADYLWIALDNNTSSVASSFRRPCFALLMLFHLVEKNPQLAAISKHPRRLLEPPFVSSCLLAGK